MAYVEVNIAIDDYLEDASTEAFKSELKSRKTELNKESEKGKLHLIKEILGLRPWHSGKRIVEELKELISFTTGETF